MTILDDIADSRKQFIPLIKNAIKDMRKDNFSDANRNKTSADDNTTTRAVSGVSFIILLPTVCIILWEYVKTPMAIDIPPIINRSSFPVIVKK